MKNALSVLRYFGIPVTRRNAIRMAYGCEPEELDAELRAEAEEEFEEIAAEQRADNLRLRALGVSTKR